MKVSRKVISLVHVNNSVHVNVVNCNAEDQFRGSLTVFELQALGPDYTFFGSGSVLGQGSSGFWFWNK